MTAPLIDSPVPLGAAARFGHACPTCKAAPGYVCRTPKGATTSPHTPRLRAAQEAAETLPTCPATAPQTGGPCGLPDTLHWHRWGHEAPADPTTGRVVTLWPQAPADRERWENPCP